MLYEMYIPLLLMEKEMSGLVNRIKVSLILLFIVSVIIFLLIHLQPVNPFVGMISADTDPAFIEQRMEELGLNDPLPQQYLKWAGRVLCGDLGYSLQYKVPVTEMIGSRMINSLILSGTAFLLSAIWGCILGVFSACRKNKKSDRIMSVASFVFISIPSFFISLILIKIFSFDLGLLPPSGITSPRTTGGALSNFLDVVSHMVLPVGLLALIYTATTMRYVRSLMVDVLSKDYISTVRVKGISRFSVIWRHGFRNILAPVVTLLAMQFPALLSGAAVTETIFVWPGIGRLSYEASVAKDYPVVMGITLVMACIVIGANLLSDVLNLFANPRLRMK